MAISWEFQVNILIFKFIYEDLFKLGDHGHDRSGLSEVRLEQVRVGFLSDLKRPLWLYPESFRRISSFWADL